MTGGLNNNNNNGEVALQIGFPSGLAVHAGAAELGFDLRRRDPTQTFEDVLLILDSWAVSYWQETTHPSPAKLR